MNARRIAFATAGAAVLLVATATVAAADPTDLTGTEGRYRGPGANLEDSRGIPLWRYDMYLDDGDVSKPGQVIAASLTRLAWGTYQFLASTAIWLIDWVIRFEWLDIFAKPVIEIAETLQQIIDRFGLVPTLLTLTAFIAGIWILRGAWSLGLYELAASLVIATLAVGLLSNPVGLVSGRDGYIMKSRDIGIQLSNGLVNGDPSLGRKPPPCRNGAACPVDTDTTPTALDDEFASEQTSNLIDVFLRMPSQAVNFGQVIDGTKCEDEYDAMLKSEPRSEAGWVDWGMFFINPWGGLGDTSWPEAATFADCNKAAGELAQHPTMGQAITAFTVMPGGLILLMFGVFVVGMLLLCGAWVLFQSVKVIYGLIAGLLPGRARTSLWLSLAEIAVWLGMLIFTFVFLAMYMVVMTNVMRSQEDMGTATTFFIADIVLLILLIVFWRSRQSVRTMASRLAQALSRRPGRREPTQITRNQGTSIGQIGHTVSRTISHGIGSRVAAIRNRNNGSSGRNDPTPPPGRGPGRDPHQLTKPRRPNAPTRTSEIIAEGTEQPYTLGGWAAASSKPPDGTALKTPGAVLRGRLIQHRQQHNQNRDRHTEAKALQAKLDRSKSPAKAAALTAAVTPILPAALAVGGGVTAFRAGRRAALTHQLHNAQSAAEDKQEEQRRADQQEQSAEALRRAQHRTAATEERRKENPRLVQRRR